MNILGKVTVPTFYNCQSVLKLSFYTLVFMPCCSSGDMFHIHSLFQWSFLIIFFYSIFLLIYKHVAKALKNSNIILRKLTSLASDVHLFKFFPTVLTFLEKSVYDDLHFPTATYCIASCLVWIKNQRTLVLKKGFPKPMHFFISRWGDGGPL